MKIKIIFILFISLLVIWAEEESGFSFWPDEINHGELEVILYQPQLEHYDKITVSARSAISVTFKEATYFGALWFKGKAAIDKDGQIVKINDVEIRDIRFIDDNLIRIKEEVVLALEDWQPVMTIQSIISDLDLLINEKESSEKLKHDPPEIIFTSRAAILVVIDGDPVVKSVDATEYEYVLNTPHFIVTKNRKDFYLHINDLWYYSNGILSSWQNVSSVPGDIKLLVKKNKTEENNISISEISEEIIPDIIIRTKPAELISTNGKPEFGSIEGTSLLYLRNSHANVILDKNSMKYYLLASGRWFRADNLGDGEWEFIPGDKLPDEFKKIPKESEISEVRVSIAGTEEAKDAVLESQIPQTAEIDRRTKTTTVQYDGRPQFRIIATGNISYAINSDKTVMKIKGQYYCVDEGIWFMADNPNGPWNVAISVPEEIYSIGPDEPIYHVRFVYIYDYTPTTVIVGYLPGYHGTYVYRGCVVYGTGYYYEPWHGHYFFSRPWTYGYRIYYHPFYGWVVYYNYPWYWYSYYPYHHHTHYYTYHKPAWKKKKPRPPFPFMKPGYKFEGKKIYQKKSLPVSQTYKKKINAKPNNLFVDPKGEVFKKDKVWFKLKGNKWNQLKKSPEPKGTKQIKPLNKKKPISLKDYYKSRESGNTKALKYKKSNINSNKREEFKKVKKKKMLKN